MSDAKLIAIVLLSVVFIMGIFTIVIAALESKEGYEDDKGFHHGKEPLDREDK